VAACHGDSWWRWWPLILIPYDCNHCCVTFQSVEVMSPLQLCCATYHSWSWESPSPDSHGFGHNRFCFKLVSAIDSWVVDVI
jgi:hypothetical protein